MSKDPNYIPLVSILVITYNSAKYVLETLESAKAQLYRNIELIISDDCSQDKTVELCAEWLVVNNDYFVKTELITTNINSGISANINRALDVSKGEWVKAIAGDDILLSTCISDSINFVRDNKDDIKCLFAQMEQFSDQDTKPGQNNIHPDPYIYSFYSESITAKEQYKMWLNVKKYWPLSTASFFVQRNLLLSVGGFEDRYRYMEDLPLYLKILEKNIKMYFLPLVTVRYRIHSESVLRKNSEQKIMNNFQLTKNQFIQDYILERVDWNLRFILQYELFFAKIILLLGNKGYWAKKINGLSITLHPTRLLWFKRTFQKFMK